MTTPEPDAKREMGRLALRQEGHLWVAYFALPDTMKDALFLGSIQMAIVEKSASRRHRFIGLMKDAVADILKFRTGHTPEFTETRPAPEHERAGRA